MFDNFEDLMDIAETCDALKMSRNSLYVLLKTGELKGYQQGRIWKIPKKAVIEYILCKSGLESE